MLISHLQFTLFVHRYLETDVRESFSAAYVPLLYLREVNDSPVPNPVSITATARRKSSILSLLKR